MANAPFFLGPLPVATTDGHIGHRVCWARSGLYAMPWCQIPLSLVSRPVSGTGSYDEAQTYHSRGMGHGPLCGCGWRKASRWSFPQACPYRSLPRRPLLDAARSEGAPLRQELWAGRRCLCRASSRVPISPGQLGYQRPLRRKSCNGHVAAPPQTVSGHYHSLILLWWRLSSHQPLPRLRLE